MKLTAKNVSTVILIHTRAAGSDPIGNRKS